VLKVQHPWGVSQREGREGSRQSCGREAGEKRFVWGGGRDCCSWQLSPSSIPGHMCGKVQGQRNTRFLSSSPQFLPASLKPTEDKAWSVALGCRRCGETGAGPGSWGQFGGSHPSQCTWALPQVLMAPGSMREQRRHFPKRWQRGGCSRSEASLKGAWPALGPPLPQLRPATALRSRKALLRSTACDILSG